MTEIVNIAEKFIFKLRVLDHWHSTVLVSGPGVAKQPRCEVRDVAGYLLDHQLSHFAAPDSLRRVKLTQESLTELLST